MREEINCSLAAKKSAAKSGSAQQRSAKLRFGRGNEAACYSELRSLGQFGDCPTYLRRATLVFFLFILVIFPLVAREIFPVPQLPFEPLNYVCHRAGGSIVTDGKLEESDWQAAEWTADFVDIEGALKPAPGLQTRVKLLWNEKGLYVAAELQEPQIWATLKERDAVIFQDNDFEVFIDPDGDTHDYYELELNALGTLWDLLLIKPYRDRQQVAVNAWDIKNIEYGIDIAGTLNDPSDQDKQWTLEMLLPWKVLEECAHKQIPPPEGDYWRVNFSRVEWETEAVDGKYVKTPGKPESNWVWSPQGLVAMHYPERWGYVLFTQQLAGDKTEFTPPALETAKEYLRQLYYRQKQYYYEHDHYAKNLRQLQSTACNWQGKKLKPLIESTSAGYVITLSCPNCATLHIREDGLTW